MKKSYFKMSDNYLVLARKYRPADFTNLAGQDFMVTTLVNSIKLNRVAHAFLLTGIRGGGKTTTARIIARTLNCSSPKIEEKMVIPCGECQNCQASLKDNHPDIIELDAASRTGVEDMRTIIDNTNYLPLLGKYKIYIIDEVHMLSTSAFNSLLKTLEEPPAHVKFIFATTELRKVPVTILSRCQKYELRRLNNQELVDHLEYILAKEEIIAEKEALQLIASHADGSVRDSLSLLDLVISTTKKEKITLEISRELLGLNENSQVIKLLDSIISGQSQNSVNLVKDFYYRGKDLLQLPQQLMEVIHNITKLKLNIAVNDLDYTINEKEELNILASNLSIEVLTILWQMLLKAYKELQRSGNQLMTAEMMVIRLCHVNNIPTPTKILEEINSKTPSPSNAFSAKANSQKDFINPPNDFEEVVQLFYDKKEMLLYHYLVNDVNLIEFSPYKIKIRQNLSVPHNFINKVSSFLEEWTGQKWQILLSSDDGMPTLSSQAETAQIKEIRDFSQNMIVKNILDYFPNAKVTSVTKH